jgi:hypothetical protein
MSGSGFFLIFKIKQCLVPGFILVPGFGNFLKNQQFRLGSLPNHTQLKLVLRSFEPIEGPHTLPLPMPVLSLKKREPHHTNSLSLF